MLAVPTTLDCHSKQYGDLQCNSTSFGYGDYGNENDTPTVEAMNRASVKTLIMSMNVCQNKISLEGVVYTVQDKDIVHHMPTKSRSMSSSLTERFMRRDAETEILNKDLHYPKSDEKSSIQDREPTGSKAESMVADWILCCAKKAHELNSGSVREDLFQVEPCSRWFKRLGHSPSNVIPGIKRSRFEHGLPCDVAYSSLSKAVNYEASSSTESVAEQRIVEDDKDTHSDVELLSDVSGKEMQFWIGRWRRRCTQTTGWKDKHPSPTQCSLDSEPEIYEKKQIPSIAAMALMAKVMNKTQKCELQKRASSTVWKAEGL